MLLDQTQINHSRMWSAINKAEQADETLRRQIHNGKQIICVYDGRLVMNNDILPADLPALSHNTVVQYCPYLEQLIFIGFRVLSLVPKANLRNLLRVRMAMDYVAHVSAFSEEPIVSQIVYETDDAFSFTIARHERDMHEGYLCQFEVEDLLLRFPGVSETILRDILFLAWLRWDAELGSQWVPQ